MEDTGGEIFLSYTGGEIVLEIINLHSLYVGFEELRGSFLWGYDICVKREDKEGTDQRLG